MTDQSGMMSACSSHGKLPHVARIWQTELNIDVFTVYQSRISSSNSLYVRMVQAVKFYSQQKFYSPYSSCLTTSYGSWLYAHFYRITEYVYSGL